MAFTFAPQAAVSSATGDIIFQEGLTGSVHASEADALADINPLSVTASGGVTTTQLSISAIGQLPGFSHETLAQVWWSPTGGGVAVHLMAFEEILAGFQSAVRSVNGITPGEDGDVQVDASGADDAGIGELIGDSESATYAALTERYGLGFALLDLDDPSTGIPDGIIILRTAGGGTPPPVPVVYAQDDFERAVALGWGIASGGGEWVAFPADDSAWSVSSGAGKYIAPAAGSHSSLIRLSSYSQSTVEVTGVLSQDVGNAGSRFAKIYPRRIVGNEVHYNATISLRGPNTTRPLQVDLSLGKGVNIGDLQATLPGVLTTGALGDKVRFRVQVIQEDAATTRVRARVWLDGTEEPATWQREATDAEPALQGAGDLMYLVQQQSSETASEVSLHEITVQSVL